MPWALTKKVSVLISICLAVVVAGLISAPSVSADAVTGKNNNGLASQTERWLRLRAIAKCFNDTDVGQNSYNQVENGEFLKSNNGFDTDVAIGYLNEDGKVSCGDGAFVTNTFAKIGYGGNIAAFCSVQPMASRGSSDSKDSDNYTGCMDGEGDEFDMDSDAFDQGARQLSEFKSGYTKHAATPAPWSPAPAIMYHVYRQSLIKFCGAELIGKYDPADENNIRADKRKLVVNDVDLETGDIIQNVYSLDRDQTDKVDDIYVNDGMQNVSNVTCSQMAQKTWDYDEDMAAYVKAYNTANPDDVGSGVEGDTGDGDGASEPVCSAGALGWVLCPVMHVMADTTEWVAGQLENYLAFNPFAGDDNAIKTIWSNLLNIANSLLVVAFLVVVFSQSTSLGLSNYGIKRMLPRIIAAAILMNLSYYICQIMVDLSNIAGVGVTNLVSAAAGSTFGESVQDVGVAKMAVAAVGIAAIILFFFLIPVVVAFLAVFFTIAARNAIIVLLVIVAPLAFAAWIFPNTEKYFKKWWELFINMLILYPLVMLVFAASIVAANVIQTAPTSGGESSDWLQTIIALIVLALPLFAMPFLFKVAGGALGKINDMTRQGINRYGGGDLANKGMQAMRGRTKERAGTIARERQARLAERFGQGYEATGRGRRTRTALGKSVGWAASGKLRNQRWEERKANTDQAFKTLYEEGRATNPTGRAALNAERKFELEQRAAGAHQMHDLHLAQRALDESSGLAQVSAGVAGEAGMRRVQATAIAKERDESRKRVTAAQELLEYRERGLEWADTKDANNNVIATGFETMYREQYREAAAKGDHETMSAVLKNIHAKGSGGREVAADLLERTEIHGPDAETARKAVERTVYEDLQLGARADIVKGGMDTATGKWNLKAVGDLPTKQIAALDGKVLTAALGRVKVDDSGQPVVDPVTGQQVPEITAEQAYEIIKTPGLRQEVDGPEIIAMLEQRAAPRLQREKEEQTQRPEPPSIISGGPDGGLSGGGAS